MPLSKDANEKMWDIILSEALEEHCRREIKEFMKDDQEPHIFSKKFEKNIRKIRNSIGRRKAIKTAGKFAFKTFTVFACIMGISFGALLTQPSVSASVINVFTKTVSPERDSYYTKINKTTEDASIVKKELGYVPEGFSFSEATITDKSSFLLYFNQEDNYITFEYAYDDIFKVYIDNENYFSQTENINGQEYNIYSYSKDASMTAILWTDDSYAYMLSAQLPEEEMFKIIENIE